jgi:hypothetical protein
MPQDIPQLNLDALPLAAFGRRTHLRKRREHARTGDTQILLRTKGETMLVSHQPNPKHDEIARASFERDWPAWITGAIYGATITQEAK